MAFPIADLSSRDYKLYTGMSYYVTHTSILTRKTSLAKLKARQGRSASSGETDIESWLVSTIASNEMDDEDKGGQMWTRDLVREDWQKAMQVAQGKLLTSSTRIRLQFLQEELLWLATNGGMC
jgi:hypothetical protein